jgi:hypothetical protein
LLSNSVIYERLTAYIAAFLLVRLKRLFNEAMESIACSVPRSLSATRPVCWTGSPSKWRFQLPPQFPSRQLSG